MLKTYLEEYLKTNRLHSSWLIQTSNIRKTMGELENFISVSLLREKIPLPSHPDFKLIEKPEKGVGSKNISIGQIRSLQEFLNKTPGVSNCKVAVIAQADLMNLNAANSCLKILEDTPFNSYIFLLTSHSSLLLPTIQSRCIRLEINNENQEDIDNNYEKDISLCIRSNTDVRLAFLKELSDKNKESWTRVSQSLVKFLSRIIKKTADLDIALTECESKIYKQFKVVSVQSFLKKFEAANQLINDTMNYDLELKASFIVLVNIFES